MRSYRKSQNKIETVYTWIIYLKKHVDMPNKMALNLKNILLVVLDVRDEGKR